MVCARTVAGAGVGRGGESCPGAVNGWFGRSRSLGGKWPERAGGRWVGRLGGYVAGWVASGCQVGMRGSVDVFCPFESAVADRLFEVTEYVPTTACNRVTNGSIRCTLVPCRSAHFASLLLFAVLANVVVLFVGVVLGFFVMGFGWGGWCTAGTRATGW